MRDSLTRHWPEYLIEAWGLGTFMVSAAVFATLLEYPGSLVHQAIGDPLLRRLLMGLAMGLTEVVMAFSLMLMVLIATNIERLARFTGLFAGCLIITYITLGAPLSGMSNPARTVASALPAWLWTGFWIYMTAPLVGMLLAAQAYLWAKGGQQIFCAKLHHHNTQRCIFRCGYTQHRSAIEEG